MYLITLRMKRLAIGAGVATFSVAVYQANQLRQIYKDSVKLYPPGGPNSGSEKWVTKLNRLKETLKDEKDDVLLKTRAMLREIKSKVSNSLEKTEKAARNYHPDHITGKIKQSWREVTDKITSKKNPRKVKLVLLGDSLVCGVGCDSEGEDNKSSPVLPKILAKILSIAMQADVEWCSLGIIGGTVADLRSVLLPEVKKQLSISCSSELKTETLSVPHDRVQAAKNDADDVEIIVVVICGLNDWKLLVEQFPYGPGPASYRHELDMLIKDIKVIGNELTSKCKVFLPAMPLVCGKGDPNYHLGIAPLTYFVNFVCYVWDQQKRSVALDNEVNSNIIHNFFYFTCTPLFYVFCKFYITFICLETSLCIAVIKIC